MSYLLASHSYLYERILQYAYPPPPRNKSGLKLVCNVIIVLYMKTSSLKNSQDYARNLIEIVRLGIRLQFQTTCVLITFMNLASDCSQLESDNYGNFLH
jgi:hypothetical protein